MARLVKGSGKAKQVVETSNAAEVHRLKASGFVVEEPKTSAAKPADDKPKK